MTGTFQADAVLTQVQSIGTLKDWFSRGKYPTQTHFWSLIDTLAALPYTDLRIATSVEGVRELGPPTGDETYTIRTLGHSTVGDGGAGFYQWVLTSAESDDDGSIIQPHGHTGIGRYVRLEQETEDIRMYGTPTATTMQKAIVWAHKRGLNFPSGPYDLDASLRFYPESSYHFNNTWFNAETTGSFTEVVIDNWNSGDPPIDEVEFEGDQLYAILDMSTCGWSNFTGLLRVNGNSTRGLVGMIPANTNEHQSDPIVSANSSYGARDARFDFLHIVNCHVAIMSQQAFPGWTGANFKSIRTENCRTSFFCTGNSFDDVVFQRFVTGKAQTSFADGGEQLILSATAPDASAATWNQSPVYGLTFLVLFLSTSGASDTYHHKAGRINGGFTCNRLYWEGNFDEGLIMEQESSLRVGDFKLSNNASSMDTESGIKACFIYRTAYHTLDIHMTRKAASLENQTDIDSIVLLYPMQWIPSPAARSVRFSVPVPFPKVNDPDAKTLFNLVDYYDNGYINTVSDDVRVHGANGPMQLQWHGEGSTRYSEWRPIVDPNKIYIRHHQGSPELDLTQYVGADDVKIGYHHAGIYRLVSANPLAYNLTCKVLPPPDECLGMRITVQIDTRAATSRVGLKNGYPNFATNQSWFRERHRAMAGENPKFASWDLIARKDDNGTNFWDLYSPIVPQPPESITGWVDIPNGSSGTTGSRVGSIVDIDSISDAEVQKLARVVKAMLEDLTFNTVLRGSGWNT